MNIRLKGSNMIGGVIYADGSLIRVEDSVGANLLANLLAELVDQPKFEPVNPPVPNTLAEALAVDVETETKKRK